MRYGDGGGVGPRQRARREQVRRQAAQMFAAGLSASRVAAELEISTKSAYAWWRVWQAGGEQALTSRGAPGPDPVLSRAQVDKLIAKLEEGPAAAGWDEDQRWTLARIRTLIGRIFHLTVSIATVWQMLHRAGYTPQQPIHRAAERDEQTIAYADFVEISNSAATCSALLPAANICAACRRTCSRRTRCCGPTPTPSPYRTPGQRTTWTIGNHPKRRCGPEADPNSERSVDAAHQHLRGPIVLIWDGLPAHKSAKMRALIAARPWLRVYRLPGYAPELNPVENMWSNLKRAMANLAPGGIDDLLRVAKNRLKRMQYRPALAHGFLATSGLAPP
ncbi:MAG TPA: winged helix-turn-helix domain-containing protein [Pilimelia sp.]|nr:winged helix-turn-helix domain-containing protein [Pilimelia sp.]